jgi:hypothetical protein
MPMCWVLVRGSKTRVTQTHEFVLPANVAFEDAVNFCQDQERFHHDKVLHVVPYGTIPEMLGSVWEAAENATLNLKQ